MPLTDRLISYVSRPIPLSPNSANTRIENELFRSNVQEVPAMLLIFAISWERFTRASEDDPQFSL
jgi:hypothetical protein